MGIIDSVGTFVGTVAESGLTLTRKSSYPQWVARLAAAKKWITDPAEIAHFQQQGQLADGQPGYVDWAPFGEDILAYMVLFKSADDFSKETALLNYEQLQLATGWDGTSFDKLADGSLIGKEVLFRVEENSYEGKTSLQVSWVDAADAPPERQLKSLDLAAIKGLSAKLSIVKKTAPAKPAVAAAKPTVAKPAVTKPVAGTPPTASTPAPAPVVAPPAASAVAPTSAPAATTTVTKAPPAAKKKTAPPPVVNQGIPGMSSESTQLEAWEFVNGIKGANEDSVVQDAWMAACGEVGPSYKDDSEFTPKDWAKVRDIVIKDLSLDVPQQSKAA